ncbi:hypothetical protein PM082_018124 [Marasmius tenuissimus]|nr:hypothetical protein PM082_018124 [Marasmius tenuissimus]
MNGFRSPNYTVVECTDEWSNFAQNVSVAAGITPVTFTKFLGGGFSFLGPDIGFTAQSLLDNNILDSEPGPLIAMRTLKIIRVSFHQGIGYKYNFVSRPPHPRFRHILTEFLYIQPVTLTRSIADGSELPEPLPPHVQPQHYAAITAAEAVRKGGNTQITEIPIDDERIAGYGFYEGGRLVRAFLINSKVFLKGSSDDATRSHWGQKASRLRLNRDGLG